MTKLYRVPAVLVVLLLSGCLLIREDYTPLFERHDTFVTARHSEAASRRQMERAWFELSKPRVDLYLVRAILDRAWIRSPDSYEPVWGWAIFKAIQARQSSSSKEAERCFTDSVRYFKRVKSMLPPSSCEMFNVDMDYVNSLNWFSAALRRSGKTEKAKEVLLQAAMVLAGYAQRDDIDRKRYLTMKAYNSYYLGDKDAARSEMEAAVSCGAVFPKEFAIEVNGKEEAAND